MNNGKLKLEGASWGGWSKTGPEARRSAAPLSQKVSAWAERALPTGTAPAAIRAAGAHITRPTPAAPSLAGRFLDRRKVALRRGQAAGAIGWAPRRRQRRHAQSHRQRHEYFLHSLLSKIVTIKSAAAQDDAASPKCARGAFGCAGAFADRATDGDARRQGRSRASLVAATTEKGARAAA